MKGRFGQSDVVEGCIFQGSIGYFKELDPPEDGKRFNYDRVLRMDYLFEEFDNQQKKKEELDRVIKEDEEDEEDEKAIPFAVRVGVYDNLHVSNNCIGSKYY